MWKIIASVAIAFVLCANMAISIIDPMPATSSSPEVQNQTRG
jgi:hypothetical protein